MIPEWETFFTAIIGTTGALLGLLFVGISLSIPKITASRGFSRAAAQPLFLLFGLLIASVFFLVPGQSLFALGVEVLASSAVVGVAAIINDLSVFKKVRPKEKWRYLSNTAFNMTPFLLSAASGAAMMAARPKGIYLMVPAVILSFLQAITISWAFLVAIHMEGGRVPLDDRDS